MLYLVGRHDRHVIGIRQRAIGRRIDVLGELPLRELGLLAVEAFTAAELRVERLLLDLKRAIGLSLLTCLLTLEAARLLALEPTGLLALEAARLLTSLLALEAAGLLTSLLAFDAARLLTSLLAFKAASLLTNLLALEPTSLLTSCWWAC